MADDDWNPTAPEGAFKIQTTGGVRISGRTLPIDLHNVGGESRASDHPLAWNARDHRRHSARRVAQRKES